MKALFNTMNIRKMAIKTILFLMGISLLCFLSCIRVETSSKEKSLVGRIIIFPDSIKIVGGDGFYCHDNEMTIVSYVDSTGCNSCKMRLSRWNNFMNGLDSSVSRGKVDLIVIANFTDGRKLEALRRRSGFRYTLAFDPRGNFALNNRISMNEENDIVVFLIDSNRMVIAEGDPLSDPYVKKEYYGNIVENVDNI